MRLLNPDSIKKDFKQGLSDISEALAEVLALQTSETTKNHVAEYSFVAAVVLLEGFISDIFVAYINNDNKKFVAFLVGGMKITSDQAYAKRAISIASYGIANHLNEEEIRKIIDPRGYNLAYGTVSELKGLAGQWLSYPHAAGIKALSSSESRLIEASKGVRNYLAHRSDSSKAVMQTSLAMADLPSYFSRRKNKVHNVGSYLLSSHEVGRPNRVTLLFNDLETIAEKICPDIAK